MQEETKETFEIQKRRGLIVWVYSLRQLKNLRRFGFVHYVSRKMKYVVMYLNEEDYEMKKNKIEQFHFVRQVEPSYRPDVEMNFAEKIGTDAAYQVSDDGFDVEEKIRRFDWQKMYNKSLGANRTHFCCSKR